MIDRRGNQDVWDFWHNIYEALPGPLKDRFSKAWTRMRETCATDSEAIVKLFQEIAPDIYREETVEKPRRYRQDIQDAVVEEYEQAIAGEEIWASIQKNSGS